MLTWFFGIPNSSSHALIGSLIGIAIGSSIRNRRLGQGVEWKAIIDVLEGLLFSPILGFLLALALFQVAKRLLHDKNLFEPPKEEKPRGLVDAPAADRPPAPASPSRTGRTTARSRSASSCSP